MFWSKISCIIIQFSSDETVEWNMRGRDGNMWLNGSVLSGSTLRLDWLACNLFLFNLVTMGVTMMVHTVLADVWSIGNLTAGYILSFSPCFNLPSRYGCTPPLDAESQRCGWNAPKRRSRTSQGNQIRKNSTIPFSPTWPHGYCQHPKWCLESAVSKKSPFLPMRGTTRLPPADVCPSTPASLQLHSIPDEPFGLS